MAVVLQDGSSDWSCQTFPLRPAGWWNSLILQPAPRSAPHRPAWSWRLCLLDWDFDPPPQAAGWRLGLALGRCALSGGL